MLKLLTWPLALAALPAQADTCDAIQAQIEAKLRAGGLTAYSLTTVDQDAPTTGRVVGTCGFGRKKIVYTAVGGPTAAGVPPGTGPAPATTTPPRTSAARPADDDIVTECKDGFIGPDCKQRRSPPVTLLPSPAPAPGPAAGTAPAPAAAAAAAAASASTSAPAPASPPASRPPASGAS